MSREKILGFNSRVVSIYKKHKQKIDNLFFFENLQYIKLLISRAKSARLWLKNYWNVRSQINNQSFLRKKSSIVYNDTFHEYVFEYSMYTGQGNRKRKTVFSYYFFTTNKIRQVVLSLFKLKQKEKPIFVVWKKTNSRGSIFYFWQIF